MVTAGVYLVARCTPLFVLRPDGPARGRACIGGFTALLAALIALTQTDLKRVLAYSTVSQLGFMFLALGSGGRGRAERSPSTAAIFHLFTHAFFKALLFLGGRQRDARDGRRHRHAALRRPAEAAAGHAPGRSCAAPLALAGLPAARPGFWSKDEILDSARTRPSEAGQPYAGGLLVVLSWSRC